ALFVMNISGIEALELLNAHSAVANIMIHACMIG
ncbi:unnamed protein product, partial [marine sediment metagenome]